MIIPTGTKLAVQATLTVLVALPSIENQASYVEALKQEQEAQQAIDKARNDVAETKGKIQDVEDVITRRQQSGPGVDRGTVQV